MRNGYSNHKNLEIQHKATFLPMLCSRPSLKDVALPRQQDRSLSFSTDPLSPKIGCMGQVKRHNNKIAGFPSSNKITVPSTYSPIINVKYSKLKRIFSAKNTNLTRSSTCSRGSRGPDFSNKGARREGRINSKENSVCIKIEEMDPPLPVVIKKVQKSGDGEEVDTLWKRRSGGLALKTLQLQQIQLNTHNVAPTTV